MQIILILFFGFITACNEEYIMSGSLRSTQPQVKKLDKLALYSGDTLSVEGLNLESSITVKIGDNEASFNAISSKNAEVFIPESTGQGASEITFISDGKVFASFPILLNVRIENMDSATLAAEEVCDDILFKNSDGVLTRGLRTCGATLKACSIAGELGCLTVAAFPPVDISDPLLVPANIRNGITIAGISGIYPSLAAPLNGSTVGLADLSSLDTASAVGSYEFFDSTGARYTGSIADAGTITPGTTDQTIAAPNTVYRRAVVQGDLNLAPVNIKNAVTLFAVTGSLTGAPPTCSSDGQSSCLVDGTSYAAGLLAGAADKIRVGSSLAGVSGNVTLPAIANVLAATSYGVSGNSLTGTMTLPAVGTVLLGTTYGASGTGSTGTLTLPSASNVKTGSGLFGNPSSQITPSYSPDFPLLGNVRSIDTVDGAAGTLGDCSAANQAGCVATTTYKTMNLSAAGTDTGLTSANFNATIKAAANFEFWDAAGARYSVAGDSDLSAINVANTVNIFGTVGSAVGEAHISCTAANQAGCVATTTYKTMDLSAATIMTDLSSSNLNASLASASNFEFWDSAGARYQANGTTSLAATNILTGTTLFGVAGSATGAPAACSSNGSQSCVASGSYFAATACTADGSNCFVPTYAVTTQPLKAISYDAIDAGKASIRSSLVLSGITGTLLNCGTDGEAGCVVVGPTYAALLKTGADSKILAGNTIGSVTGNVTLPAVTKVLSPTAFGVSGTGSTGTLTLPLASNVKTGTSAYGESGSQLTPSYSPDFPSASNVRTIDTVDNAAGTLGDCSAANQSGCVATTTYKTMDLSLAGVTTDLTAANFNATIATAANFEFWDSTGVRSVVSGTTNLSVGNVKSGVPIFGVTGDYPSATYTLPSASATADLDAATFDAKAKSATAFEYWNSAGSYQTGAGDADITPGNIKSGVTIFGLTGTASAGAAPDPWNVRVGTVINGVTGQLKTSCRNRANASLWDAGVPYSAVDSTADTFTITGHPFTSNMTVRVGASTAPTGITINSTTYYVIYVDANTIMLSASSGPGAQVDITAIGANVTVYQWSDGTTHWWDTIEDYNNNLVYPTSLVAGWSSDTDCNYSNWQDLTADGTCDAAVDNCIMKDQISGLTWSESYPVAGAAAAVTALSWQKAIQHCNNLSFGGFTGWRLATQKELMEAYIHGIRDVGYNGTGTIRGSGSTHNNNQFILNVDGTFWSASAVSNDATSEWKVFMDAGFTNNSPKSGAYQVLCVR